MENVVSKLWKNYRRRFVPWMATNIKGSEKREVTVTRDKIANDQDLKDIINKLNASLHKSLLCSLSPDSEAIMQKAVGYSIKRSKSSLKSGGTGVVMSEGFARKGDFIAFYPGTLYRRFEPLFLPSICNHFILRCADGIHIDGNDRFLSKTIYRSCVSRDSYGPYQAADLSWLSGKPTVPWNVGQYVNNGTKEFPANVAYQELDIADLSPVLDYLLPNIWYSGRRDRHLRTVALVATRNIVKGDEILSNYITVIHDSK